MMWKSEDIFVEPIPSSVLYVDSRGWTQTSRLTQQVPLSSESLCQSLIAILDSWLAVGT